jgi:hypothetical protein
MILTQDQLKSVCEASEVQNFKVGDKFVQIYSNVNRDYKKREIFSINKIEDNVLLFTSDRQKKNRYFIDDSELICKL